MESSSRGKWIVGVVVVVILIIIGFSVAGGDKQKASGEAIRVGVIAPLTGTAASYGVEGKNAVVLALEDVNANGGIGGKPVEYVIEDGKCEATASINAWNKLVSVDKVDAVFGGHCSTETLAIAPLSEKSKVPVFAVFTTAPVVPNEGEWVFRHISTNDYYAELLAEQAYKAGHRNVAVLTEVKDFPATYSDAFIPAFKALGGNIVADERFDPGTKDYRTIALKLKGKNYDAIFISAQGSDVMGLVTNQVRELGLEKPFLYNHAFGTSPFLKATKGYVPPNPIIVTPYANAQSPKLSAFIDAYFKRFGQPFIFNPLFLAADYDIVHRFRDAANYCIDNGGYNADCVRDQFKKATSYSGVAGDVTISSKYSPFSVLTEGGRLMVHADGTQSFEPLQ